MGYLKDRHGMMMLDNVPPDTCPECAVVHDPQQPHNRDSLYYQYKIFTMRNGMFGRPGQMRWHIAHPKSRQCGRKN